MVFTSKCRDLDCVDAFKYLVWIISSHESDWPEIVTNIHKNWDKWVRISRILVRKGADISVLGNFYRVVVQSVLPLG